MRRIVIDTNCLLQSLPSNSPYHKIWTDVLDGKIQLCVNTEKYIVTNDKHFEVLKKISWPRLSVIRLKEFVVQICNKE